LLNYLKSPVLFRATTQRRNGKNSFWLAQRRNRNNLFWIAQRRNGATGITSFGSRNDATAQREYSSFWLAQRRNGATGILLILARAATQRKKLSEKNSSFRVTIDLAEDTNTYVGSITGY